MRTKKNTILIFIFILITGVLWAEQEENNTLLLKLGDPDLKHKTMEIFPGKLLTLRANIYNFEVRL